MKVWIKKGWVAGGGGGVEKVGEGGSIQQRVRVSEQGGRQVRLGEG